MAYYYNQPPQPNYVYVSPGPPHYPPPPPPQPYPVQQRIVAVRTRPRIYVDPDYECPECHQGTLIKDTTTMALLLMIIICFAWPGIGSCIYLSCLDSVEDHRCTNCNYRKEGKQTRFYIFAIIMIIISFATIITLITLAELDII